MRPPSFYVAGKSRPQSCFSYFSWSCPARFFAMLCCNCRLRQWLQRTVNNCSKSSFLNCDWWLNSVLWGYFSLEYYFTLKLICHLFPFSILAFVKYKEFTKLFSNSVWVHILHFHHQAIPPIPCFQTLIDVNKFLSNFCFRLFKLLPTFELICFENFSIFSI